VRTAIGRAPEDTFVSQKKLAQLEFPREPVNQSGLSRARNLLLLSPFLLPLLFFHPFSFLPSSTSFLFAASRTSAWFASLPLIRFSSIQLIPAMHQKSSIFPFQTTKCVFLIYASRETFLDVSVTARSRFETIKIGRGHYPLDRGLGFFLSFRRRRKTSPTSSQPSDPQILEYPSVDFAVHSTDSAVSRNASLERLAPSPSLLFQQQARRLVIALARAEIAGV